MFSVFEILGLALIRFFEYVGSLVLLLIETLGFVFRGSIRLSLTIQQMAFLGVNSVGIVIMTTTFAGMVMSLQLAHIAVRYGVSNVVGGGVALAMCRELGPMLTAVVVAGRAGAAITAEIGTMKVTEQIDALTTLSTNPVKYLVVPRVLAATLAMPALVAVGDAIGILGGYLVGVNRLGFNPATYLKNTADYLELWDVGSGLVKGAVFGFIVAVMGCYYGMHSGRGAQGVGRATKGAVVAASVLILAANYLLTEVFFSA